MRQARLKAPDDLPVAYYHCISRVVDRAFVLGPLEKETFLRLLRKYEVFCGVRVVTFCIMDNHFHLLLEIPRRPQTLPTDDELLARVRALSGGAAARELRQALEHLQKQGAHEARAALRESYFRRMWDVSAFMKALKQRFSVWFNRQHERVGTLWEERYKSVLVEGAGEVLAAMAAYIDLNPVRAGMVADPKDYRWCGYAETVAGKKAARAGLAIVASALENRELVRTDAILARYRLLLFGQGEAKGLDENGAPLRKGFTPEEIEQVFANRGKLTIPELIRCRVRYFADGAALGGKQFVNAVFAHNRDHFSARRLDGARPVREANAALFTLRRLHHPAVT
jgi:putative transposase